MQSNYGIRVELCYMNTDSFVQVMETRFLQRHGKRCRNKNRYKGDIQRMKTGYYQ